MYEDENEGLDLSISSENNENHENQENSGAGVIDFDMPGFAQETALNDQQMPPMPYNADTEGLDYVPGTDEVIDFDAIDYDVITQQPQFFDPGADVRIGTQHDTRRIGRYGAPVTDRQREVLERQRDNRIREGMANVMSELLPNRRDAWRLTPDEAARRFILEAQTGVPADMMQYRDIYTEAELRANMQRDAESLMQAPENVFRWFLHPRALELAHDDIEIFSKLSRSIAEMAYRNYAPRERQYHGIFESIRRGARSDAIGAKMANLGMEGIRAVWRGEQLSEDFMQRLEAYQKLAQKYQVGDGWVDAFVHGSTSLGAQLWRGKVTDGVMSPEGMGYIAVFTGLSAFAGGIAGSAVPGAGTVAGGITAGVAGLKKSASTVMTLSTLRNMFMGYTGATFNELIQAGVSPDMAMKGAVTAGVLTLPLNYLNLNRITKYIPGLNRLMMNDPTMIRTMLKSETGRQAVARVATNFTADTLKNATSNMLQEIAVVASVEISKYLDGVESQTTMDETTDRITGAFVAMIYSALIGVPGVTQQTFTAYRNAQNRQMATETLTAAPLMDEAAGNAEASNTLKRTPQTFKDFVENVNSGQEHVYMDSAAFAEIFGDDAQRIAEQLGISEEGDITIRTSELLSLPEVYNRIKDDIRFTPDGMTRKEANEVMAQNIDVKAEISAAADEIDTARAEVQRRAEQTEALRRRYADELMNLGHAESAEAAEATAAVQAAMITDLANKANMDVAEFAERYAPSVIYDPDVQPGQRQAVQAATFNQPMNADVDLNANVNVVRVQPTLPRVPFYGIRRQFTPMKRAEILGSFAGGVVNEHTGMTFTLPRDGLDHIIYTATTFKGAKAQALYQSIPNLAQLVKEAYRVETHIDKKPPPNVVPGAIGNLNNIHRFLVPVEVDGAQHVLMLIAKEFETGRAEIDSISFYDMQHVKRMPGRHIQSSPNVSGLATGALAQPDTLSVRDIVQGVNDADGQRYYQAAPIDGTGTGEVFDQSAYHGSPHRFEGPFSTQHIGIGEGNQAFGWGLYFASRKNIAEWYREKLTDRPPEVIVTLNGKEYRKNDDDLWTHNGAKIGSDVIHYVLNAYEERKSASGAITALQKWAGRVKPEYAFYMREAIQMLESPDTNIHHVEVEPGQVYKVDVPESDVLLNRDISIDEQPEHVRNAIAELDLKHDLGISNLEALHDYEMPGGDFYDILSGKLGSDRAASMALLEAGVPGLQYLDGVSRRRGEGTHNFVIWNDAAIQTLETYYQPPPGEGRQQARGQYQALENIITVFKRGDKSTVIHEMSHYYLQTLRNMVSGEFGTAAQEGARAEWAAISQWLEISDIDMTAQLSFDNVKRWRTAQEKFAAGFEKYTFEGVAPTTDSTLNSAIIRAFESFKKWMAEIYTAISNIEYVDADGNSQAFEINDEIRAVFDRIVASDTAIQAARNSPDVSALRQMLLQSGASQEVTNELMQRAENATGAAKAKLLNILNGDITPQRRAELDRIRETMTAEAVEKLREEKMYRTEAALTDADNDVKLSRSELEAMYGSEVLNQIPEGVYHENGISIDFLAQMHGYDYADTLIGDLKAAKETPLESAAAAIVETHMANHNTLTNPESLAAAISEALHTEESLSEILYQMEAVRKQIDEAGTQAETGRIQVTGKEFDTDARQFDLSNPQDVHDLTKIAKNWYTDNLQGTTVEIPEYGTVQFTNKGKGESTTIRREPEKLFLIPHLRELLETARIRKQNVPLKGAKASMSDYLHFDYLENTFVLDGVSHSVRLDILVDRYGNKFYDLTDFTPSPSETRRNEKISPADRGTHAPQGDAVVRHTDETFDQSILDNELNINIESSPEIEFEVTGRTRYSGPRRRSSEGEATTGAATDAPQFSSPQSKREYARREIAKKKIRNIDETLLVKMQSENRAQRMANQFLEQARNAETKEARKNALNEALRYLDLQAMNHAFVLEMQAARDFFYEQGGYLREIWKNRYSENLKKEIGEDTLAQIRALLSRNGFGRGPLRENIPTLQDWGRNPTGNMNLSAMTADEINALEDRSIRLPGIVRRDSGRPRSVTDLTYGDFLELYEAVRMMERIGAYENKMIIDGRERAYQDVVDNLLSVKKENHGDLPPINLDPAEGRGTIDAIKRPFTKFFSDLTAVEYMTRDFDGWKDLGAWWSAIFKPIADAEKAEIVMKHNMISRIRQLQSKLGRTPAEMKDKVVTSIINPATGERLKLTRENLIALALNWGTEKNRQRVVGGFFLNENMSEAQAAAAQADPAQNYAAIESVLENLTARDWEFVQGVWEMLDSYWPQIARNEKEMSGITPGKEQGIPVNTAHGVIQGGYYPIKYNPLKNLRAHRFETMKQDRSLNETPFDRAAVAHGYTHGRAEHVNMQISLELDTIAQHLNEVAHDLTHRKAVNDVSKLINDKVLAPHMEHVIGRDNYKQLNPWLKRIARPQEAAAEMTAIDNVINKTSNNLTVAVLGWNFGIGLNQLLGVGASAAKVGNFRLARFMYEHHVKNLLTWGGETDSVFEKSIFMRNRANTFDRDIRETLERIEKSNINGTRKGVLAMGAWWSGKVDLSVTLPTWKAAYSKYLLENARQASAGSGTGVNQEQLEARAVDYADMIIRTTNNAGSLKDLSAFQRKKGLHRIMTFFYTAQGRYFNMTREELRKGRQVKDFPRLAAHILNVYTLPFLMSGAIGWTALGRNFGPQDEDDSWLWFLARGTISGIVRPMIGLNWFFNQIDVLPGTNPGYRDPLSDVTRSINSMTRNISRGLDANTQENIDLGRLAEDGLRMAGPIWGLPSVQVRNSWNGAIRSAEEWDNRSIGERITHTPMEILTGAQRR